MTPHPFRVGTGLMGSTGPGQVVTAENIGTLPPGSTVRTARWTWLVHLHDDVWLHIFECGHCYDRVERFHCELPGALCHHAPWPEGM
jgi:hypothetical protein